MFECCGCGLTYGESREARACCGDDFAEVEQPETGISKAKLQEFHQDVMRMANDLTRTAEDGRSRISADVYHASAAAERHIARLMAIRFDLEERS